uniref:Uncharacterized protein n=2 Tax=Bionectria ochroleuca TaxID=29856 RepID=A0A0B7KBH0_BIOOC
MLLPIGIGSAVGLLFAAIFAYITAYLAYNAWFNPLRKYPGPLFMRATRLGYLYKAFKGTLPFDMLDLHKKYGPVVRIAPNELAFADPAAWNDIQGHRTKGQLEFEKAQLFYRPIDTMEIDIISADRTEHGLLRRTLSHGFSDKSLREQQPLIQGYIDKLIERLHENSNGGSNTIDIMAWYNFTTFDIIGDLAFGEPFGCLDSSDYHPWVRIIFQMARAGVVLQALGYYPSLKNFLLSLVPDSVREQNQQHEELTNEKLRRRMELGAERPDLIEGLLRKKDEWGLTMSRLSSNAGKLIIGGSETTATLLSGVTYYLAMNPAALEKVTNEVRSTFKTEDEIDFNSVNNLTYMLACLNEALRMYPPVPVGLPRVAPKGGANVCGHYVPEGTVVGIHQWALYHNDKFFKDPFNFHPERFLGDNAFESDVREAFQPFHVGPRNCIGKNLAYVEMRTILARVLFNFDMRPTDATSGWEKQRVFNLWEKPPLPVYLTSVKRS